MNGLENLGNTCCINTLVQCIRFCPILCDSLLQSYLKTPMTQLSKVTVNLLDVINKLEHTSLCPKGLVQIIFEKCSYLTPGEQLDIVELWCFLSDILAQENGLSVTNKSNENMDNIELQVASVINQHNSNKTSAWIRTIQGTQLSIMQCSCGFKQGNIEVFTSLNLDILDNRASMTLLDLLENHFGDEHMETWKCDSCAQTGNAKKFIQVWHPPPVLVVTLKRFRMIQPGIYEKINKPVDVPETFNMQTRYKTIRYKLMSIAQHHGSYYGGHYTAICRHTSPTTATATGSGSTSVGEVVNDQWVLYNDVHIHNLGPQLTYESKNVYFVVYQEI